MTRKTRAGWIGFLAGGACGLVLGLTPAIIAGGVVGLIAYSRTSGPPMSRKGKAAWIGFLVPVVPAWGILLYQDIFVQRGWIGLAVMAIGIPSILLGVLFAAIASACTKNKERDPLKCAGCGYSLVGLESDKCPECGKKTP